MGLAAWLGFRPKPVPSWQVTSAPIIDFVIDDIRGQSVERLWREQPHLRTVIGFAARNIAQLGVHVYRRAADDGRERQRDTPLSRVLAAPNGQQTTYELIYALVADLALYDVAYWWISEDVDSVSRWVIRPIPPRWVVGTVSAGAFTIGGYKVVLNDAALAPIEIPASEMLVFHGWNPTDPRVGTSPVEALKSILAEQVHAQIYREQAWKRGGRVGAYLSRPKDAPEWSPEARDRFATQWTASFSGDDGPKAGGNPILEDGMTLQRIGFSAKDDQYVEANKLSLATCASVYYINPTMVGLLDNANYSNVREFRRMLYGDTLGPTMALIQDRINTFLAPMIGDGSDYVEFNIEAKLAGSFEEQGAVMQQAIGGPWMTINEGRAMRNMPAVDGGGELIRPLNVTQNGDQNPIPAATPGDTAPVEDAPKSNGSAIVITPPGKPISARGG